MALRHGKDSKVTLNAATVCVTAWSVNTSIDSVDSTTTCSGGFKESVTALKDASFDFSVNYDSTAQETAGVLAAIEEGDTVSLEFFAFNTDTDPLYDMPTARINGIATSADVNGVITITYSGVSNGEYDVKGEVVT